MAFPARQGGSVTGCYFGLRGSSASWRLEFLALREFRPFGDGWVGGFGSFGNFRTIGTSEIFDWEISWFQRLRDFDGEDF